MAMLLELSYWDFKSTMINTLRELMDIVNSIWQQISNLSTKKKF